MFGWLEDFVEGDSGDFLKGAGDVAGALGGIFGSSRRDPYDEIPTLQSFVDAKERARAYSSAAADPESTFFKNQASLYDELQRKDLVGAITKIMRQNNRGRARGGAGFGVNPERRDESRYRALIQGFQDAKIRSRFQARDTLFKLSQQANTQAQGLTGTFQQLGRYGDINAKIRATRMEALTDLPGAIGEMFKKRPQPIDPGPTGPAVTQSGPPSQFGSDALRLRN